MAYLNRGGALGGKGDFQGAIRDLKRAIELDPKCDEAYCSRGRAHAGLGQLDEALQDLRRAVELAPGRAEYHGHLAGVQYRRGELDEAIESLGEVLRLDPTNVTARGARNGLYLTEGQYDLALADAEEVVRLAPENAKGYLLRGAAFLRKGHYEHANIDTTRAIKLAPTSAVAHYLRGGASKGVGQWDAAIGDFSKAIELGLEDAAVYFCRGDCYFKQHKYGQALTDYNKAVELEPSSPFAHERRAAIWIHRGECDRGLAEIEKAISLNPGDPAAAFAGAPEPASEAALKHGEEQVRKMLGDRPAMGQYGEAADVFYKWAARMFAREHGGKRILWDAAEPPPGPVGMCHSPRADRSGSIRLRSTYDDGPNQGEGWSFEALWMAAVFELYNVKNTEIHERLVARVLAGGLSKDEYVRQMIDNEARAADSTRAFYVHVFLPWAMKHKVPTHPTSWFVAWRSSSDETLLRDRFAGSDYWRHYECEFGLLALCGLMERKEYGEVLKVVSGLPRNELDEEENTWVGRCVTSAMYALSEEDRYEEAIELAEKLASEMQTVEEKRYVGIYKAGCLYRLNRPVAAIDAYSEVIRLDPTDATVWRMRSGVYLSQEKYDLALADAQEAVRLAPENAEGYLQRGTAYGNKRDYEQAQSDATQAIRLAPNSTDGYFLRGQVCMSLGRQGEAIDAFGKAIELGLENPWAHLSRGDCYFNQAKYDEALADYERAIELAPSSPFAYERRGVIWIQQGEWDRGLAEIKKAIRLNPGDPGATFDDAPAPASEAALKHGQEQVRRMLEDRPAMGKHGEAADVLCQWAARMFAREHGQERIFWDGAKPASFCDAASYTPREGRKGSIRVLGKYRHGLRAGEERSFEELWMNAVFELHNVNNADLHARVHERARAGEYSKDEYVRRNIDNEARAAESTRAFYIHVFLPWAMEHEVPTLPTSWFVGWRSYSTDNLLRGRFADTDYWRHYEREYEVLALHALMEKEEYGEVLSVVPGLLKCELGEGDESWVRHCALRAMWALMMEDRYAEAIEFSGKLAEELRAGEGE